MATVAAGKKGWRATCSSCGWQGKLRSSKRRAKVDATAHRRRAARRDAW